MHRLWKFTGAAVLALGLTACKSEETTTTPGTASLAITPAPRNIQDDGSATQVSVSALDADGKPGTGDVVLSTLAGTFDNDKKSVTLTLASGKALTTFRCLRASDPGCTGFVRITGDWNQVSGGTSVQVTSPTTGGGSDGGTGGTDGGTGGGADGGTQVVAGPPANIVFVSASAKPVLGIRSSGLETSTPMSFVVTDLNQVRVPNAAVNFDVRGAGGATLSTYSGQTDSSGVATTTLQSGDEVGIATVRATVAGTNLTASTLGTPIVGARPSDEGFVASCDKINLAANATETPPRQDLESSCQAQLVDRFRNPVTLSTNVNWYAEAGSIQSPIASSGPGTGSTGGTTDLGDGIVTTKFRTAGKWPPADVSPLKDANGNVIEPVSADGVRNPRDMLVTVIAVTSGEEEFYDGSGLSNGVKNGKWDPGEWFVDVAEPFVDENDNQVYDPGEPFIDTERVDCATGQRQAKNGKWDGPNGCWDGDIQIWRPTHILYSGFSSVLGGPGSTFKYSTDPHQSLLSIGTAETRNINFSVYDDFFNPLSPDSPKLEVKAVGDRGTVTMSFVDGRLNTRYYGMSIFHERLELTPDASAPGGYKLNGTCNPSKMPSSQAATDPKYARCVRQYRIANFVPGNYGTLTFKGSTDGKGPSLSTITVSAGNDKSFATDVFPVQFQ